MFRAIPCSSSGGHIVLLQHLVSSLSVRSHSVHQLKADCSPLSTIALNGCLRRVTIPDDVTIQFDLLKMSMVLLETCRGLQCNIYYYRINKLCIKLVIETSLHYDARSEKHQIPTAVGLFHCLI
jgi:hypothetical protein